VARYIPRRDGKVATIRLDETLVEEDRSLVEHTVGTVWVGLELCSHIEWPGLTSKADYFAVNMPPEHVLHVLELCNYMQGNTSTNRDQIEDKYTTVNNFVLPRFFCRHPAILIDSKLLCNGFLHFKYTTF
jgi:hypothetical protein